MTTSPSPPSSGTASRTSNRARAAVVSTFVALAGGGLAAITPSLNAQDLNRALTIARAADPARARFHAPYTFVVDNSPVRQVDVITEFRRAVILTEDHLKRGDWIFGQGGRNLQGENLSNSLTPWKGLVTLTTRIQFDPRHAYSDVPRIDIVVDGSPSVSPVNSRTIPQTSFPKSSAPPSPGSSGLGASLLGADVEFDFVAADFGQTTRPVRVLIGGAEQARLMIDFGRLE